MLIEKTFINDLIIFTPNIFEDERGYFFESFNKKLLEKNNINVEFVQDNESYSRYGTLRGLHFQTGAYAQTKLVRVVKGSILDVVVDLRVDSASFGKHYSTELSQENKRQLFIPKGFAHGFVTLSSEATVQYKCDNYYNKKAENGIVFSDVDLQINWQLRSKELIINRRDRNFQTFAEFKQNYQGAN